MKNFWKKLKKSLRTKFLAGIFALIPIVLTIYVFKLFLAFFDSIVGPVVDPIAIKYLGFKIPGLGLVSGLFLIFLLGLLTSNIVGKSIFHQFEKWVNQIPLIKTVYSTSKKILTAFQLNQQGFEKVVFFEFPRKGIWSMGFVTGETEGKDGTRFYSVFLPTTPNPTSGWMIFLPQTDVVASNLSVEEGLQTLISAGTIVPKKMNLFRNDL
ncbi:MAG: DUF502 domain-containing protein [Candidatus Marinimicrobia bacterium]|nr:DUF502 domain-containing protein [Candidatus Neomarinimicrobiota bacterium]